MMDITAFKHLISRRSLLKSAPLVAATAVSLDGMTGEAMAQQNKLSHVLAKYQDGPKDGAQCSNCSKFVAPSSCQVVADPVTAEGWCQFYAKA